MASSFKYYVIFKPFGMISQFSKEGDKPTLGELYDFPKDVYPVGRLDTDSEGMLILTNDTSLNHKILHPSNKHFKTYWVQLDGKITADALNRLSNGVQISIKGKKHNTASALAKNITPINLPERIPPIRVRKNIPTSWIELTITEGKNRQVRRMTAQVGFPTLRLIRKSIQGLAFSEMIPGNVEEYSKNQLYESLSID